MDTPSLKNEMETLRLICRCGASIQQTDLTWRLNEAGEEFRRVHSDRASCEVGPYRDPIDALLASWDRLVNDIHSLHGGVLAVCAEQVRRATGRAKGGGR